MNNKKNYTECNLGFSLLSKREGGLGLKKLVQWPWNSASVMCYIWNLFVNVGSIWVVWVNAILLRGRSFWRIGISRTLNLEEAFKY
jgi:hypothetical protein